MVIGRPATKADPATHFIREAGTIRGAYRFKYAPYGKPTGLCVADPGYDAAGTGLRHGLVLRAANNGPWQQWYPMGDGTLNNAATFLIWLGLDLDRLRPSAPVRLLDPADSHVHVSMTPHEHHFNQAYQFRRIARCFREMS
jgi:hypothetical protein